MFWHNTVLGLDEPYGEETRTYRHTTRARHLAPKLRRLVRTARAPITIMIVGDEHQPGPDGRCPWTEALAEAAAAGAAVRLYVPSHAGRDEAERARALARAHPQCHAIALGASSEDRFCALSPVVAWAGDRNDPADALLWLEDTREPHQTTTCAEYRNGSNLRANPGMLEKYAASVESAAAPSASGSAR